jgi:hypothetical protein
MVFRGDETRAAILYIGECAKAVLLDLFCGVRCYVALECGASYEDTPNRLRCYIIPSEALAHGKSGLA